MYYSRRGCALGSNDDLNKFGRNGLIDLFFLCFLCFLWYQTDSPMSIENPSKRNSSPPHLRISILLTEASQPALRNDRF